MSNDPKMTWLGEKLWIYEVGGWGREEYFTLVRSPQASTPGHHQSIYISREGLKSLRNWIENRLYGSEKDDD